MSFLISLFYLLSLSVGVGSILFFSFFLTPLVFIHLPKEIASQFLTIVFPRYYMLCYGCFGLGLLATLGESLLLRSVPWLRVALLIVMLGSSVYAGQNIRPRVHDLKIQMKSVEEGSPLGDQLKARFDSLHRQSVVLNMLVLLLGIALLGMLAFRLRV